MDCRAGSLSLRVSNQSHADGGGLLHCPLESRSVSHDTLAILEHESATCE